jgi:hypothetical protein
MLGGELMRNGGRATAVRLAAEFVIIVAGVLAALAVDQWRESQTERDRESELLQAFLRDLRTDSADYSRFPRSAGVRMRGIEVLRRTFTPEQVWRPRVVEFVESLEPIPAVASDSLVLDALGQVSRLSDLDIAWGAYRDFSEGGAYRLIRNTALRDRIHDYYYRVDGSTELNEVVRRSVFAASDRLADLGLSPWDLDATEIRARLSSPEAGPAHAAMRTLQNRSASQWDDAQNLDDRAADLRAAIRSQLAGL